MLGDSFFRLKLRAASMKSCRTQKDALWRVYALLKHDGMLGHGEDAHFWKGHHGELKPEVIRQQIWVFHSTIRRPVISCAKLMSLTWAMGKLAGVPG